ncbi:hypothetical protein MRB53_031253 [Persea americana]|uniref:Uncharacterized protein n=1 Tax=Persea americana TaxID=3435 RepID=A0ACC2KP02_PERAE|nr:hypothetical protein MRB53_031253 [Persea americana]
MGAPAAGRVPERDENPRLEFDAAAGKVRRKAPDSVVVQGTGDGGEADSDGGFVALGLGREGDGSLSKDCRAVDDGDITGVVYGGQLLIAVADGEYDLPLRGEIGGGDWWRRG